jgi:hypothetical protein
MLVLKKRALWSLAACLVLVILLSTSRSSNTTSALAVPSTPPSNYTLQCQQCRADLTHLFATYAIVGDRLGDARAVSAVNRGKAAVSKMSNDDLQDYVLARQDVARLREAADSLKSLQQQAMAHPAQAGGPESAGFPSAPYSELAGDTRSPTGVIFAAKVVVQAARLVWSLANRGCNQVVVVAGEGANTSLACTVADAIYFVALSALEDIDYTDDDIDSAEINGTYLRVGHIHSDLETVDGKIDALTAEVEALRQANCEIIRLLNTPDGLRSSSLPVCADQPGFPYSFPHHP